MEKNIGDGYRGRQLIAKGSKFFLLFFILIVGDGFAGRHLVAKTTVSFFIYFNSWRQAS